MLGSRLRLRSSFGNSWLSRIRSDSCRLGLVLKLKVKIKVRLKVKVRIKVRVGVRV